jgi:hypothetical protein
VTAHPVSPSHAAARRWFTPLLVWSAVPYVAYVPWTGRCVLGHGGWEGGWALPLLFFYAAAWCLAFPVAFGLVFAASTRAWAVRLVLLGCSSLLLFVLSLLGGEALRMHGFALAAERAEPLVAAMDRYIADRGKPPSSLTVLVPQYLASMPDGLPPLRIESDPNATHSGKQWMLIAYSSAGPFNWDTFVYLPEQDYPAHFHGGSVQRLGKWAYVHE